MSDPTATADALFERAAAFFQELQARIVAALEEHERTLDVYHPPGNHEQKMAATFLRDPWQRTAGTSIEAGGGLTRVLENGRVFERAGVNFSDVSGTFTEEMGRALPGESRSFRAAGVSLVLHPLSPQVPTVHANFRVIRRGTSDRPERLWFGGGADLTPYLLFEEDAVSFHTAWRDVCARHPEVADYGRMKHDCDRYFFLPHRAEARGIGGIFFDYLDADTESVFAFVQDAGATFLGAYEPILRRRAALPFSEAQRRFQLLRRGRYVEFNLVYDRGTQFGLRTGGRTESILMSLPPVVHWDYGGYPEEFLAGDSRAQRLLEVIRAPRSWL